MRSGVRFNAICPARVETPFVQRRIEEYADPAAAYCTMTESQPVGRMAKPEEIAAAALLPGIRRVGIRHRKQPGDLMVENSAGK